MFILDELLLMMLHYLMQQETYGMKYITVTEHVNKSWWHTQSWQWCRIEILVSMSGKK